MKAHDIGRNAAAILPYGIKSTLYYRYQQYMYFRYLTQKFGDRFRWRYAGPLAPPELIETEALCILPLALLVAAHIKPRSECSRQERLDAENIVFGVCVLGCDALYEKGFVAVLPGGKIHVTSRLDDVSKALRIALKSLHGRRCAAWKAGKNDRYFAWHKERRFQGN
jgi:hypothetical protein